MSGAAADATQELAAHAAGLRFADLPRPVVDLARDCLIDAVACAVHGSRMPWSRMVAAQVAASAAPGPCRLPAALPQGLAPSAAALVLGTACHAFELDSLSKPGSGVHPGATVALPALIAAQATGASGEALLTAIVAGCEVMFRLGQATLHTPEAIGFHAPGITGPFGAATATGLLLGLDARQLAGSWGLAASMAGGLLNFARSGNGGMVKRLHLGRAAEAGVLAALLTQRGFLGPSQVLDTPFGVLDVFCEATDPAALTRDLGAGFQIEKLCLKRYACHVTAQIPVEVLRGLMAEEGFSGRDIAGLSLHVSDKVAARHAARRPDDLMLAQYSVPFAVAVAAHRDIDDPAAFASDVLEDEAILRTAGSIALTGGRGKGWGMAMEVVLADGRRLAREADSFTGCPERPLGLVGVSRKFETLTDVADWSEMRELLDKLTSIEHCTRLA